MSALHRTITFTEVYDGAVAVAKYLYLHVPWTHDGFLEDQLTTAKGRGRLCTRQLYGVGQFTAFVNDTHAAAAATGSGFYHQGQRNFRTFAKQGCIALVFSFIAGHTGYTGCNHPTFCLCFVAHKVNRIGSWADKDEAGILTGFGKLAVLTEKTVAWMNRFSTAGFCRSQNVLLY